MHALVLDTITLRVSPVTVMKCLVGMNWRIRTDNTGYAEYRAFASAFFPWLLCQPDDQDLHDFCDAAITEIDRIRDEQALLSGLMFTFGWQLKNTLADTQNQRECLRVAAEAGAWLAAWEQSPEGQLAGAAVATLAQWGVRPLRDALVAIGAFGSAVHGQYVRDLRAVCLQLDVIQRARYPRLNLLETLLHEEVHAALHALMGDDAERRELVWLEELACVLTSQAAIRMAAKASGSQALLRQVVRQLEALRACQAYGDLAEAVLREARHPLVPWHVWQDIARLPAAEKRDYARLGSIGPILQRHGWHVRFPYRYGNRYVTVFR